MVKKKKNESTSRMIKINMLMLLEKNQGNLFPI